jgi:hypothetical protein
MANLQAGWAKHSKQPAGTASYTVFSAAATPGINMRSPQGGAAATLQQRACWRRQSIGAAATRNRVAPQHTARKLTYASQPV